MPSTLRRRVTELEAQLVDTRQRLTRDEQRLNEVDNALIDLSAAYSQLQHRLDRDNHGGQQ